MRDIPDDNLAYPVLLEIGNGLGSGFYFLTNNKIFLVTARHVLYNDNSLLKAEKLKLICYDRDLKNLIPIEIEVDLKNVPIRKDDSKDVAVVEMGTRNKDSKIEYTRGIKELTSNGNIVVVPSNLLKKLSDVLVSNEVYILGYPMSLGMQGRPQIEPKRPLLRKGIIAGINNTNGTIILDCPVYFGNSGGLVIEVEVVGVGVKQFRIIGVVVEFVPFVEKFKSLQIGYENSSFENSGYSVVVPIDTIIELTKEQPITVVQVAQDQSR